MLTAEVNIAIFAAFCCWSEMSSAQTLHSSRFASMAMADSRQKRQGWQYGWQGILLPIWVMLWWWADFAARRQG
jgi:hypothetical protein